MEPREGRVQRERSLTRRDVLRGGAVVAGAAWVTPVISALSMTQASADTPSGVGPTGPSFSIDPTEITAPPDPPTATATVKTTESGTVTGQGSGEGLGGGGNGAPQAAGRGQLAATGVNLPVATTTAVAVGAVAAGVAAVVLGNKASGAADGAEVADAPRGPRRH